MSAIVAGLGIWDDDIEVDTVGLRYVANEEMDPEL